MVRTDEAGDPRVICPGYKRGEEPWLGLLTGIMASLLRRCCELAQPEVSIAELKFVSHRGMPIPVVVQIPPCSSI